MKWKFTLLFCSLAFAGASGAQTRNGAQREEVKKAISNELDVGIYWPVARAQQMNLACGDLDKANELADLLMGAAMGAVSTVDLVKSKLEAEQSRCCKTWQGQWVITGEASCDAQEQTRRNKVAYDRLSSLYGNVEKFRELSGLEE